MKTWKIDLTAPRIATYNPPPSLGGGGRTTALVAGIHRMSLIEFIKGKSSAMGEVA